MRIVACILAVMVVGAGPATRESVESELRRINQQLREQIAALKAENAELRKRIAGMPTTQPQAIRYRSDRGNFYGSPDIADDIHNGMTKAEVMDIMGRKPQEESTSDSLNQFTWDFVKLEANPAMRKEDQYKLGYGNVVDRDQLQSFGDLAGRVKVQFQNGVVVHVNKYKPNER